MAELGVRVRAIPDALRPHLDRYDVRVERWIQSAVRAIDRIKHQVWALARCLGRSAGGDGHPRVVQGRIANAKSLHRVEGGGWADHSFICWVLAPAWRKE